MSIVVIVCLLAVLCVCSLVYRLIGRIKEVKDCTAGSEKSYYTSLLNSKNMVCVMHLMSLVCSI